MDLAKLKLFAEVTQQGSLTKAAVALGSVPSAISRQIAALERECGARLFHRTGRGLALTELGERILPQIRQLLADVDQLSQDIRANAGVPMGEVRVGFLPSISHPLIAQLFKEIRAKHPGIRLHIFEGSSGQLDEWLTNGNVDMAVLFRYGKGKTESEEQLAVVDTYLIGKTGDPITRAPIVEFSQIDNLPLILPGRPNGLRVTLDQMAKKKNITLSIAMEANSLHIQKDVVAEGCGYAILTRYAVAREVQSGMLQASRIVNPSIDCAVQLGTTTVRPATLATREVARLICRIVDRMSDEIKCVPESIRKVVNTLY